ncbi:MAG: glycosyltransferase family 2 protein [Calditrichia bacterium]|nr:glycosyltransferase family 2 protein [Calditrichia bacterium]
MLVDIVTPVRNGYVYFRQLYESIRHHIPDEIIGKIIVIDDHSSEKILREYLQFLDKESLIKLVRNGMPLPSYYSGIPIPFLKSKGHGGSLNIGLKYVSSDYVFFIDPDCIVMKKDILHNALACFDLDPLILSVGQVTGGVTGVEVIGEEERRNPKLLTEYVRQRPQDYGFTNTVCMLAKMDSWNKHNLDNFRNEGWAHAAYIKSLFNNVFKTCNFDFFIDGYVIHLGKAILSSMKFKWMKFKKQKKSISPYGVSAEDEKYGFKKSGEYYSGYLELKIPSVDYYNYLTDKYINLPFDRIAPPVEASFFGPPEFGFSQTKM